MDIGNGMPPLGVAGSDYEHQHLQMQGPGPGSVQGHNLGPNGSHRGHQQMDDEFDDSDNNVNNISNTARFYSDQVLLTFVCLAVNFVDYCYVCFFSVLLCFVLSKFAG